LGGGCLKSRSFFPFGISATDGCSIGYNPGCRPRIYGHYTFVADALIALKPEGISPLVALPVRGETGIF